MTVVSVNDPTGVNVTSITFTYPGSLTDPNAVKAGDLFEFNDGVSGKPNMRFLTFIGHKPTRQKKFNSELLLMLVVSLAQLQYKSKPSMAWV